MPSKTKKNKKGGGTGRRWGTDLIGLALLVSAAVVGQVVWSSEGRVQTLSLAIASASAALGLGLVLRFAPARGVLMLMLGVGLVADAVLLAGSTQLNVASAGVSGGGALPVWLPLQASELARPLVALLFLLYLSRPRVAAEFSGAGV